MGIDKVVFLLPFAGGSSWTYAKWKLKHAAFHPIEYSGHGYRYREPLPQNMDDIAEDVIDQIESAGVSEYFLFGHSVGALLAWLVTQRIEKKPKALFVSACEPPGYIDIGAYKIYQNDDALMRYVMEYGRVSDRQRESKVFQKIVLPMIKNDFRILSEYIYKPYAVLDIPITVLYSKEDMMMRHNMMKNWKEFSTDVHFEQLSGNHFYLEEEQNRKQILEIMKKILF